VSFLSLLLGSLGESGSSSSVRGIPTDQRWVSSQTSLVFMDTRHFKVWK
jgi:hypothetical protein